MKTTGILIGRRYPSTELREISDPRIFLVVDGIILDDGELPLQRWCEKVSDPDTKLVRTFTCEGGTVLGTTIRARVILIIAANSHQITKIFRSINI